MKLFGKVAILVATLFVEGCTGIDTKPSSSTQASLSDTPHGVRPLIFKKKEDCVRAMERGYFSFYTPIETGGKGEVPQTCKKAGSIVIRKKIETPACVNTLTTSGKNFVIIDRGTAIIWRKKSGEDPIPCGIEACGNPIFEAVLPSPEPALILSPEPASYVASTTKLADEDLPPKCSRDILGKVVCERERPSPMGILACVVGGGIVGGIPGAAASLLGGGIGWLINGNDGAAWGCVLSSVGVGYYHYRAAASAGATATQAPPLPRPIPVPAPVNPPL